MADKKYVKVTVAYDGTNYYGWQKQKGQDTIQARLEGICEKIFGEKIDVWGASRTDSGVHAEGQVAIFPLIKDIDINKIPIIFNTKLPLDIVVKKAEMFGSDMHVSCSVKHKTYVYTILNSETRDVKLRNHAYFHPGKLNIKSMKRATKHLLGEHDFKAFCSMKTDKENTVRMLYSIKIKREGELVKIIVKGKGFLRQMVRIIVGTLIAVGEGKIEEKEVLSILEGRDRKKAGPTAPAWGLSLKEVNY